MIIPTLLNINICDFTAPLHLLLVYLYLLLVLATDIGLMSEEGCK